jgi:predicted small secreted protein
LSGSVPRAVRNRFPPEAFCARLRSSAASNHRRSTMIRTKAALAFFLAALSLGACNTIEGLGQDVEEGGQSLSGAANDVEQEIEN